MREDPWTRVTVSLWLGRTSYPTLQNGVEYAVGDSFPDGAKVVYDGANDTYTDLAANSSAITIMFLHVTSTLITQHLPKIYMHR